MTTRQHRGTAPSSETHHPDALGPDTHLSFPSVHLRSPHGGPAEGGRGRALTTPGVMKTAATVNSLPLSHADARQHLTHVSVARRAERPRTAKES